MQRRTMLVGLPLASLVLFGCASTKATGNPLMGMLTEPLGLTEEQAGGGIGSMLTLAQEKLTSGDFSKVASAIPGSSQYLDKAKSLGAVTGPLTNAAGLTGAFNHLGISPSVAQKFVPTVTNFVGKAAGSDIGHKLSKAML